MYRLLLSVSRALAVQPLDAWHTLGGRSGPVTSQQERGPTPCLTVIPMSPILILILTLALAITHTLSLTHTHDNLTSAWMTIIY